MTYDPILREVHAVKDATAAKYGNDVRKLIRALRQSQKKRGARVVDLSSPKSTSPPKRRREKTSTKR